MRNIKLTIEYDGTDYAGWQIQNPKSKIHPPSTRLRRIVRRNFSEGGQKSKIKTVQETIERVLEKILQEKVRLIGSGRTDAGVHAKAQIANFKTHSDIPLLKLRRALNSLLLEDIVISKVQEVSLDFHARYSARSKVYRYTILNRQYRSAHLKDFVYFYSYPLDVRSMKKEAKIFLGRKDFRSFQASDKKCRTSIRKIKKLNIEKDGDFIHIDIEADGFLYNMVRNVVGTLIEVGSGKSLDIKKLLSLKDRTLAGPTAVARGLCLMEVKY